MLCPLSLRGTSFKVAKRIVKWAYGVLFSDADYHCIERERE